MRHIYLAGLISALIVFTGCLSIKTKEEKTAKVLENTNRGAVIDDIDDNVKKNFKKWKKKLYSNDPNIQTAAAVSLLNLEYYEAFELLLDILKKAEREEITVSVLKALGFIGDDRALDEIILLLDNGSEKIRLAAAETLGKLKTRKAQKLMISNLLDSQRSVASRILIAQSLGNVRDIDSVEPLINILKSDNADLLTAAHDALVKITRQPIGKDVNQWIEWWDINKIKSREEWLEDIVEYLEDHIKQIESKNEILNKEIASKSIELLELYSNNNSDIKLFLDAAKSKYPDVRVFAANELAKRKPPEAKDIFSELLLDENLAVRIVAAQTLGEIADKSALESLLGAINDENTDVKVAAVKALGRIEMPQAVDALISMLNSEETKVVRASTEALGQIGNTDAAAYIIPLFQNSDSLVREAVAVALGKIKDNRSIEPLINALSDKEERVRWYAADSLGKLNAGTAVAPLISLLSDSSARVRESATESLGKIGDEAAVEHLTKMLDDPDKRVVEQASNALLALAGEKLEALDNLANTFFIKKDYDKAIKVIEKQLAKYSENEEALWNSRIRLAKSFAMAGNWDKAANLYTMLIEHFQDDIELKKELLRCMLEMKQYEKSLGLLSDWIKGQSNNKEIFWKSGLNIINILFSNGEYEKVKDVVDKFENENPELGGGDLMSDFIGLREKSILKIKEKGLSFKKIEGAWSTVNSYK